MSYIPDPKFVAWLATLDRRTAHQQIMLHANGRSERVDAMTHALALLQRRGCSCINCIRAKYVAAGRSLPFQEA